MELFLSQKSQFDLVEKIQNKDKNRTRASLSQFAEDGKKENFMWPNALVRYVPTYKMKKRYEDR